MPHRRIARWLPFMILFLAITAPLWESLWRDAPLHAGQPPQNGKATGSPPPSAGGGAPKPSPSPVGAQSPAYANELQNLGGLAEDIYGLAKGGKWKQAEGKLEALKRGEQPLRGILNEEGTLLLPRLIKTTADLEEAVNARNRVDSMRYANRITFILAVMAGQLESHMSTNLNLLDYFGRELEIWSEAKNVDRLSNLVVRMHLTWQNLMPQLITNGCGAKHVKRFSEIMKNLEIAKTAEEYGRLAVRVSEEVESLDKACRNDLRTRPAGGGK